MQHSSHSFQTTRWSMVGKAGSNDPEALDALLEQYIPALKAHLVRVKREPVDRAEDVIQDFLAQKVLKNNLVGEACPDRGKFRNFVLTALQKFLIDKQRAWARERNKIKFVPNDDLLNEAAQHADCETYDVEWARSVLRQTLSGAEAYFKSKNEEHYWELFRRRILLPLLEGTAAPDYVPVARELGFTSVNQAYNALVTVKRNCLRILKEIISAYSESDEQVDEELRDLHNILSGARGR